MVSLPRLRHLVLATLACLPAVALAQDSGTGQAPQVKTEETPYKDWTLVCETPEGEAKRCVLSQALRASDGSVEVLKATVGYFGEGGQPALVLTAPLGIALRPGIAIQVDQDEPFAIPFERCHPNGCLAGTALDSQLLASFKAGTAAKIELHLTPRQARTLELSLSGFTAGLDAIPKP